ncbi:acyltransferase [Paenibacillus sp. y28]|uniref:acyltransferase n=1 Tax=Paenibacillus sp. y28 TaxID=3129110 RepID=UPI00301666C0
MGKKTKITELDYLRAFAFLAVVLQHAIGHYAYYGARLEDGVLLGSLLLLAKFAVPMFIFITGMVLFYNYRDGVRFAPFIRKRFKDILLPYLPWAVLYACIQASPWQDWTQFGLHLATGTASYHLWYIIMIFQFYLVFPLIRPAMLWLDGKLGGSGRRLAAGLAAIGILYVLWTGQMGTVSSWFAELSIPVLTGYFGEYSDRNALYFFFYFVLGAAAGLHVERFRAALLRWQCTVLVCFGVLSAWMLYRIVAHFTVTPELVIHYNDTLLIRPAMAVVLISSVLAMYVIAIRFGQKASPFWQRLMTRIGSYSYTAYLAHALMLTYATRLADGLLPFGNATLRTVLAFAICAALSVAAAMLLRRIAVWLKPLRSSGKGPERAG